MRQVSIRRWSVVHTWTSLISTIFMLMLCLTGLPLIFHDEIHDLTEVHAPFATTTKAADVDAMVRHAEAVRPKMAATIAFSQIDPIVRVFTIPSWKEVRQNPDLLQIVTFDAGSGAERERSQPVAERPFDFLDFMLRLHVDMFLFLPGQLFLGAMDLLLIVAIVSGIVLYGPFTRKQDFGTVRTLRSRRVRWLDLHNLLGIISVAWLLVVGATGVLHEISVPLYQHYLNTDVAAVTNSGKRGEPPPRSELVSIERVLATVREAVPSMRPLILFYPGNKFSTADHFMVQVRGQTQLTSKLETSVLVDARTGRLSGVVEQPWYLKAVQIGRPLHYGNYGGLPLKIIWALLDIVTIFVLCSGLYLWIARRRRSMPSAGGTGFIPQPAE